MTATIRFGLIGGGLMGREFASATARWMHLADIGTRPVLAGVCDTNADALEWFAERVPGLHIVTQNHRELLASPAIDAIYCAVPHHLHAPIYEETILAGKHLLGEKPFGIDRAANERVLAASRARPDVLVRCSSEFPFFPGALRVLRLIREQRLGRIIEARAGFLHSSDLDPRKPINWKRRVATCGAYGCMGDLGMHVLHIPLRAGWHIRNVRALLSKIVAERPGPDGALVPCETWDNALLACEAESAGQTFPLLLETKRIAPGETNTWFIEVYGTERSVAFSTREPKTLRLLEYTPGEAQAWQEHSLGYESAYPAITGAIFEFGFGDALLQMWAAFCDEVAHREEMRGPLGCVTPEETAASHVLFTAALESQERQAAIKVDLSGR
jgi:predicted dehydrogenase